MNICDTLKSLRLERNLTQYELAKHLNIGQATIAGYESGAREPRIGILVEYANFFECSVDYLIGREDDFGNILIPPTKKENPFTLNQNETELLKSFNSLDDELQAQTLGYVEYLAKRSKNMKRKN